MESKDSSSSSSVSNMNADAPKIWIPLNRRNHPQLRKYWKANMNYFRNEREWDNFLSWMKRSNHRDLTTALAYYQAYKSGTEPILPPEDDEKENRRTTNSDEFMSLRDIMKELINWVNPDPNGIWK